MFPDLATMVSNLSTNKFIEKLDIFEDICTQTFRHKSTVCVVYSDLISIFAQKGHKSTFSCDYFLQPSKWIS